MSNKEWWQSNKLPLSGYQSNIIQHNENKSFYPFNSELGYRVYQRIIEMKSGSTEHQRYTDQINCIHYTGENNHVYLKGAYSQSSLSIPSNGPFNYIKSKENIPEFQLALNCDIDDLEDS
ncbi:hypothetical protein MN116_008088 [Schistosoma mekongi]|uniref:Uncharacterized protein n=1 Tax=Schistosoma mekongi TaxID=38744 RepID=A0AAE2D1V3_SCHME|nr:hypothetical protein MN116_008088 [Schistosoma mekongi]